MSSSSTIGIIIVILVLFLVGLGIIVLCFLPSKIKDKFRSTLRTPSPIINDTAISNDTVMYAPVAKNGKSMQEEYQIFPTDALPTWGDQYPHIVTPEEIVE